MLTKLKVGQSDSQGKPALSQCHTIVHKIQLQLRCGLKASVELSEQKYAQHIKVSDIHFFFQKRKVTDQSELSNKMKDSNI